MMKESLGKIADPRQQAQVRHDLYEIIAMLLMDEPLLNLDAKLRVQMRTSIREIQRELNITTIYVTHDQEEALAVSDRIAVMNMGVVEQVGKPFEIYSNPVNAFVANFIGVSNFLDGTANAGGVSMLGTAPVPAKLKRPYTGDVRVSVRPEHIELGDPREGAILTGTATIMIVAYTIRKLPFTLRSSIGTLYQIEPAIEEASISLGEPPMRTFFKTTAILMLPGMLSGAVLSFVATINELSSTIILYFGGTSTISAAIYTTLFADAYGPAAALSTILTASTILALILFNKISGGKSVV